MRCQHRAKIEDFLLAQNIRADAQYAHYRLPCNIVLIVKAGLLKNRVGERQKSSQRNRRMVHEKATDNVMLVAEPARLQGLLKQQNPGVFQTARSQHKGLRPDVELPSIQRASV